MDEIFPTNNSHVLYTLETNAVIIWGIKCQIRRIIMRYMSAKKIEYSYKSLFALQ